MVVITFRIRSSSSCKVLVWYSRLNPLTPPPLQKKMTQDSWLATLRELLFNHPVLSISAEKKVQIYPTTCESWG